MISVNIKINNFTVYFKGDMVVKFSPFNFAADLSPRFTFIYPFLYQFVTRKAISFRISIASKVLVSVCWFNCIKPTELSLCADSNVMTFVYDVLSQLNDLV